MKVRCAKIASRCREYAIFMSKGTNKVGSRQVLETTEACRRFLEKNYFFCFRTNYASFGTLILVTVSHCPREEIFYGTKHWVFNRFSSTIQKDQMGFPTNASFFVEF